MRPLMVLLFALVACGGTTAGPDASVDAGPDAGLDAGPTTDAGLTSDSGFVEVDAGPAPRTVFGAMTVNGAPYELWSGYGTQTIVNHQLRLGTLDTVDPRVQVTLVLPGDAGPGYSSVCGGPDLLRFAARWLVDGGIAFFTLRPTCAVTMSQVASQLGEDYVGTFSGTLDLEPRSVLDAGFPVMTITGGTFSIRRTF